jgi:hypothetical protein
MAVAPSKDIRNLFTGVLPSRYYVMKKLEISRTPPTLLGAQLGILPRPGHTPDHPLSDLDKSS